MGLCRKGAPLGTASPLRQDPPEEKKGEVIVAKNQPKARPPRGTSTKRQPKAKGAGSKGGTMSGTLNSKPPISGGKMGGGY